MVRPIEQRHVHRRSPAPSSPQAPEPTADDDHMPPELHAANPKPHPPGPGAVPSYRRVRKSATYARGAASLRKPGRVARRDSAGLTSRMSQGSKPVPPTILTNPIAVDRTLQTPSIGLALRAESGRARSSLCVVVLRSMGRRVETCPAHRSSQIQSQLTAASTQLNRFRPPCGFGAGPQLAVRQGLVPRWAGGSKPVPATVSRNSNPSSTAASARRGPSRGRGGARVPGATSMRARIRRAHATRGRRAPRGANAQRAGQGLCALDAEPHFSPRSIAEIADCLTCARRASSL